MNSGKKLLELVLKMKLPEGKVKDLSRIIDEQGSLSSRVKENDLILGLLDIVDEQDERIATLEANERTRSNANKSVQS